VLLGVVVAAQLFGVGTDVLLYGVYDDAAAGKGGDWSGKVDLVSGVAGIVQGVPLVATAVVYLCWFWRVRVNAEVFEPAGHSKKRGWAIAGWFVPFVNLWFPRRVMGDIWRASAPLGRTVSQALVSAWWAAWVLWLLMSRWVNVRDRSAETLTKVRDVIGATLVMDVLGAVAAVLAILVVVRVTGMQDEKARVGIRGGMLPLG